MLMILPIVIMLTIGFSNTILLMRLKSKLMMLQLTTLTNIPLLYIMLMLFKIQPVINIAITLFVVAVLELVYYKALK